MARLVAAFGSSHSTMLFSSVENWLALFDHVDCRAPVNDLDGTPRSFDELLKKTPPGAAARISREAIVGRHAETWAGMDRLRADLEAARLDALTPLPAAPPQILPDPSRP